MVGGMGDFYREKGWVGEGSNFGGVDERRRRGCGGNSRFFATLGNDRFSYTAARFCVLSELT